MTPHQAVIGRGAHRVPLDRRWSYEGWQGLKGLPWDTAPADRVLPLPMSVPEARAALLPGP